MKSNTFFLVLFLFFAFSALAQQQKTNLKLLADNNYVRAFETTLKPGEKTDMHTHPAHFYYALTDGKLIVHYSDGKSETYELKAGDADASDPERPHMSENGGPNELKFLVVELKEHPYKEQKKK